MADETPEYQTIQSWVSSFYNQASHKWIHGTLILTYDTVLFHEEETETSTDFHINIHFSSIKMIKKTLSSFVFGAITFVNENNHSFWFSSFCDRNRTFLILQHFYQSFLLRSMTGSHDGKTCLLSDDSKYNTQLGGELLKNVYDSKKTLESGASMLADQGQQLSSIACAVEDIKEDLTVAERITSGLSSWLGRWKIPNASKKEDLVFINQNDIADVIDLQALFAQLTTDKASHPRECVLRVGKDGMTILDLKQKILKHFKWVDLSRIRVISPWEILLTQYLIGQADLNFNIICASMPSVCAKLEQFAHSKMEYMQLHVNSRVEAKSHSIQNPNDTGQSPLAASLKQSIRRQSDESIGYLAQKQTQGKIVSDAEAAELSATLKDLKSLALDISEEQDSQLSLIERVTESVEHANHRQKMLDKKMTKLMK